MVRTPNVRRVGFALVACLGSVTVASCADPASQDRCQTGRETAEGAVQALLEAAASSDLDAACEVTNLLDTDDLTKNIEEISAFVVEAGGVAALSIDSAEQLGRAWWVTVRAEDSVLSVEFSTEEIDGRWLVISPPTEEDDKHGPSSDPNPPEATASTPSST